MHAQKFINYVNNLKSDYHCQNNPDKADSFWISYGDSKLINVDTYLQQFEFGQLIESNNQFEYSDALDQQLFNLMYRLFKASVWVQNAPKYENDPFEYHHKNKKSYQHPLKSINIATLIKIVNQINTGQTKFAIDKYDNKILEIYYHKQLLVEINIDAKLIIFNEIIRPIFSSFDKNDEQLFKAIAQFMQPSHNNEINTYV